MQAKVRCVDRARLVETGGARDDSPSWNLGRAAQGDTIRVTTWIHGSEGVRWRSRRRVAVRQQDGAQVDRDWPEEGISAVSSVSSVRRTNASRRQEQLRVVHGAKGKSGCFRVQQAQGKDAERERGRMHGQGERLREFDETSGNTQSLIRSAKTSLSGEVARMHKAICERSWTDN